MTHSPTLNPPAGGIMLDALVRSWWLIFLRGIFAILFVVLQFAWPSVTLLTLFLFFGAFMLIEGGLALGAALSVAQMAERWWLLIVGLLGIAAGLGVLPMPGDTFFVALFFIAAWAITIGVVHIIAAIRLRKEIDNASIIIGVLSVVFGIFLIFGVPPGHDAIIVILVIDIYAIIYGVMLISHALRLRKHSPAKA